MKITTFNHEMFGELRTVVMDDGQIGFVGKDVAKALVQIRQTGSYIAETDEPNVWKKAR